MYLQDAFNYTTGTQLGNNSPWAAPSAQITVASGGLTYPGLADFSPAGNMVANVAASGSAPTYGTLSTTATGGAVYYSFVAKATSTPGASGYYISGLLPSTTTTPGGRTTDPIVLMAKSATGGFNLGVGSANAAAAVYASAVLTANTTNLLVLKYDLGTKVASLYLNPTPGGTEPGTPDATVTGSIAFSDIKYVYFRTPSGSGNWDIDTLRIASTWSEVTPTASDPPTISPSGQPQSQTVETGSNVTFSVSASGSPTLAYQWYFNTNTPLSFGTNAVLPLPSVTTNDAGTYNVVVTNQYGTNISAYATLTVNPPQAPLITADPSSQSVTEGSSAGFSVTATGSLPLVYQWYKVAGGVTNVLTGQNNTTYTLGTTALSDDGSQFYAVVTNDYGLATSELATLQVLPNTAPPTISSQPHSQTVQPGANVSFSVTASGADPLRYQWFFNLTNVLANATNAIYSLASADATNQGGYDVIVTNAFGSTTSVVATLTVNANASSINPLDFINPRFSTVDTTSGITYTPNGYPSSKVLDLYQPHGDTNALRPVIVWIHGGSLKTGTDQTQGYIVTYCTDFAKRGYVCMSIDYRVHSGSFPCTPQEECSLPQLQLAATDTDTAFDWIRANAATYKINTNWMFVAGGSAGGMVAVTWGLVDGTNSPATPQKVFNHDGLIAIGDLWGSPEPPKRWYIGTNNPNQYNLPPYHYLDTNDAPLVIIHGTADTTVPFQNSIDLTNELTQAGVGFEIHPIPGAGHTPTSYNTDIEAWVANFFANTWQNVLTPPAPTVTVPTVVTQPATGLTAGSATLNGSVNPNGGATTCYFQYGLTAGYGSYSATNTLPAGNSPVATNAVIAGLLPGTLYHYQVVANNSAGSGTGSDATFTTPADVPAAVTQPASAITPNGATLNATVNPNGAATTCYFQYGTDTSYGSYSATNTLAAGTSPVGTNVVIAGLFPGTLYHYQVIASNSAGTGIGSDATFTTAALASPQLSNVAVATAGAFQFAFSSTPGATFTVLFATNPALPVHDWTVLGPATEGPAGQYHFIDPQATNSAQRFYQVRSP